jgi:DNA-binding response OmpR family regulator
MIRPTILLLEEDDNTRPIFKEYLIKIGYDVIVAVNEEDARQRIGGGQLEFDLILIDAVRKPTDEALNIGHRLRRFAKSDQPLAVIAAEYDEKLQGEIVRVGENDYVVYLEYGDELSGLLAALTKPEHAEIAVKLAARE